MRAVIQRVSKASVNVEGKVVSSIDQGMLILLGIVNEDTETDIEWLSKKIVNLRIFNDDQGIMNKSLLDTDGDIIVVSQFTLMASTRKGNRPSYIQAARPDVAVPLYEQFLSHMEKGLNKPVGRGVFGADMQVSLVNEGPVTIIIDSKVKE